MRYWDPPINEDNPPVIRRTTQGKKMGESRFPLRSPFSSLTEIQETSKSEMAPEARLDDLVPEDRGAGSKSRERLLRGDGPTKPVVMTYAIATVSNPPTDDEIRDLFGTKPIGFTGLIFSSVVWLVVKGTADSWWYEQLTKAT